MANACNPTSTALTAPVSTPADPDQRPAGLRDPNDPTYRRPLTQASDLPRDKQQAAEKITAGLMNLMQQGVIRSRQDVVTQLESYGLTVARETKAASALPIRTAAEISG